MTLNGIPISENECIGDSLVTINNAFQKLASEIVSLSSASGDVPLTVIDSNTINLSHDSLTNALSANLTPASITYSHLASTVSLSATPTEAIQPRIANAWLNGVIGMTSAGTSVLHSYNCSMVYVKPGVVRITFNTPFSSPNSYVFSWSSAEAGSTHHIIAEAAPTDSGLTYSRQSNEIVLGFYKEGSTLETSSDGKINVIFFGV